MTLQSDECVDSRPWWEYPTLTVGEIADIIRRPDQDRRMVIERIRYWTHLGLLTPVGAGRRPK